MSYRDRRDRDDYRGGGDRNRGYGGGRDGYGGGRDGYGGGGGGRDGYGGGGGGRDGYGGGRDGYGGGRDRRDNYGGGGRDRYGGGRDDWGGDRRRDGGGRRFGGGGGGYDDDRRRSGGRGGGGRFGGSGGGGRFGGGGGGKRMGGFGDGPPSKRQREESNWDENERHGMMQHVFMESKPENFEEDWVFVVCPPGKRRLLVSANEITQSYNNAGAEDLRFNSCLPSGSEEKLELDKVNDLTILDAVYSAEKKVFYIVDMIHWKHYPYHETESDFRFYCLNDKWAQLKSPEVKTENNEYPLHSLPKIECTENKINEALLGFDGKIEGLLFVKKQALYKYRESSECQWLKLDKMEKVLGFAVPEGVVYAASNTKDEKRLQEQDQKRKKLEEKAVKDEQEEGGNDDAQGEEQNNDGAAAVSGGQDDTPVEEGADDGNQDQEMGGEEEVDDDGDQ